MPHAEATTAPSTARGAVWRSRLLTIFAVGGPFSVVLAVMLGLLGGVGSFTFGYGEGHSYLSNDPQACMNCHIMEDHYDSWLNSSHKAVAVCNDCHLPHDPPGKWVTKADNGFFHSLAFTLDNFHEPIQIKPRNRRVTQNACLHCHAEFVHPMFPAEPGEDMLSCIHPPRKPHRLRVLRPAERQNNPPWRLGADDAKNDRKLLGRLTHGTGA